MTPRNFSLPAPPILKIKLTGKFIIIIFALLLSLYHKFRIKLKKL
jgi:hypothetical protein